jgi:hypothetical protein
MLRARTGRGKEDRHGDRLEATLDLAVAVVAGLALYWFAPWNLFIDRRVDEALPGVATPPGATPPAVSASGPTDPGTEPEATAADPAALAQGEFASLEHTTSGTVLMLELDDGSRFLRLQDLDTSNGPDLRVILSEQPLSDDWHVWDDGRYVDLGALKGNLGSSNYAIPARVDLADFETAVIWCRRFAVGFGVAPLEPV